MDFNLDSNTLLAYADEASGFGSVINWQSASKSTTKVPVRKPETQALPVFDPAAGQAAALEGAALSDTRYIARRALTLDALTITTEDRAVHSLISRSDWEDAKRNPESSVDIDELVRRDVAAQVARTVDAVVTAKLSTAATVEYVDDFASTLEEGMANLEDRDIDGTVVVLPRRVRQFVRTAKTTDGQYLLDPNGEVLLGLKTVWVSNAIFPTTTDLGMILNPLFLHGAVIPTDSPRILDQTYAHAGQIAVENYLRLGAEVLDPGTGVPAVRLVNEVA